MIKKRTIPIDINLYNKIEWRDKRWVT